MHYYQHHIGDFVRATSRLTDSQCMAYLRMLWAYYETESPLPKDEDQIAFKIGANASDVHQILQHFFFEHEGMWHHCRCDKEILAYRNKSAKAKESANARWNNAKAMRTHNERNANEPVFDANHKPITINQVNKKTRTAKALLSFSEWFASLNGEKPLRDDDPIFDYCEKAGISTEILIVCWKRFKDEYEHSDKKYKDWRETFRKAVRGNWHKCYYQTADGEVKLTTVGISAMRVHQEAA